MKTRKQHGMNELMELAARVERLAASDRETDGLIWAAWQGVELLEFDCSRSNTEVLHYNGNLKYPDWPGVGYYTASIDAAMTLGLPDRLLRLWQAADLRWYAETDCDIKRGRGATAPLALCSLWLNAMAVTAAPLRELAIEGDCPAAALRAKASMRVHHTTEQSSTPIGHPSARDAST